jgi:hypothetical protein
MSHSIFAKDDRGVDGTGEDQLYGDDFADMKGGGTVIDAELEVDLRVIFGGCCGSSRTCPAAESQHHGGRMTVAIRPLPGFAAAD